LSLLRIRYTAVASSLRLVLGRADPAHQLLRAVLVQQGQQLLPDGQLEQVDQPARTVALQHGPPEILVREGTGGRLGIGGGDPVATGAVTRSPQRPGELGTAPELERRADRHLVGGRPLLAGEPVARARRGDTEPLRHFIGTALNSDACQAANLNYWAYWIGEVPETYSADEYMAGDLGQWSGAALLRRFAANLVAGEPLADLYAHSLWALLERRGRLLDRRRALGRQGLCRDRPQP
jgi:hypothetical protein